MSMENNKKVIVSGPLMPSTKDTPIDARTRVATLDDIVNIQVPYVGMIFFVISEGKHYTVKSLKDLKIDGPIGISIGGVYGVIIVCICRM